MHFVHVGDGVRVVGVEVCVGENFFCEWEFFVYSLNVDSFWCGDEVWVPAECYGACMLGCVEYLCCDGEGGFG